MSWGFMLVVHDDEVGGDTWSSVGDTEVEVAVHGPRGDVHFAAVRELEGVAHEVEKHLRQALFVTTADRQRLGNVGLER
jgi:hypothetical protein